MAQNSDHEEPAGQAVLIWPFAINWFITGWTPALFEFDGPHGSAPGTPCRLFISPNLWYQIDPDGTAALNVPGIGLMELPEGVPVMPTNIFCCICTNDSFDRMIISAPTMAAAICKAVEWLIDRFLVEVGGIDGAQRYIEFISAFDRKLTDPLFAAARLSHFIADVTS